MWLLVSRTMHGPPCLTHLQMFNTTISAPGETPTGACTSANWGRHSTGERPLLPPLKSGHCCPFSNVAGVTLVDGYNLLFKVASHVLFPTIPALLL